MIVLRALQGFFGGVLIPLAFSIIVAMLPPAKRAAGFAGFAVTATFAPAIGPTIGGWLTDNYGWPTIFYMNLVPGAVMVAALVYALPRSEPHPELLRRTDWLGIALMAIGLATFQTVLDEGNVEDWFGSPFIVKLSLVSAVAVSGFIIVELIRKEPLIQLRLLLRRSFGFGTLANFLLGFALYGSAYLLPQYLAVSQGFDAQQSGEVVAWTGIPQLFLIPLVPFLMGKFDARYLVAFGQALVMTPLSAVAMVGIQPSDAGAASGLFNMLRNLGGAVGTAAIETFVTKREQFHSFIINGQVSTLQPATVQRLSALQQYFIGHGAPDPAAAMHRAIIAVGETIRAQATLMAYADAFALLGVVLVAAVLAVAMLRKGTSSAVGAH
jgi:DHA2 family multidrug resistance protein